MHQHSREKAQILIKTIGIADSVKTMNINILIILNRLLKYSMLILYK